MKLADFFVEIGMEGDSAVVKGMGAIDSSIKGATMITGAFIASLTGAFYGLSRLTRTASRTGAEYKKFQNITGVNTKTLQKWETAARKASVSEESLRSSIVGVQDAITQMQIGGGAPKGLVFLQELEGFDPTRMNDAFYMLSQIQRLSQKLDPAMMREFAGSFGVSTEVLSAMRENAFNPQSMLGGASYSTREIEALKKMSGQWNTIMHDLEVSGGKFAARFGEDIVGMIDKVVDKIEEFSDHLIGLTEDKKVVDGVASAFKALYKTIELVFNLTTRFLSSDFFIKGMKGISEFFGAITNTMNGKSGGISEMLGSMILGRDLGYKIVGPAKQPISSNSKTEINDNKNVNVYIQESDDARSTATEVQKILNRTYSARAGALNE